jgi:nucleoside-diphosphate-sugar epimerase
LKNTGKEVVGIDIKHGWSEDLRFMQLDFKNIDSVYFLAWDVGGAKYLYEADTQLWQLNWNLKLLSNVMPQLQRENIPFLFVSSQLAYNPNTAYGATKVLGEVWTKLSGGISVRLWNVYGVLEEPSNRSHVVSDFVYSAVRDKIINMSSSGLEKRQFVHIDDVCRAFVLAMETKPKDIYDITSSEWISIMDVAKTISAETGAEIITGKESIVSLYPTHCVLPGWIPTISLETGIMEMIIKARNE